MYIYLCLMCVHLLLSLAILTLVLLQCMKKKKKEKEEKPSKEKSVSDKDKKEKNSPPENSQKEEPQVPTEEIKSWIESQSSKETASPSKSRETAAMKESQIEQEGKNVEEGVMGANKELTKKQSEYNLNVRDEEYLISPDQSPITKPPLAPGDIMIQPDKTIIYNAPFSERNVSYIRLTNKGCHRIGWAIKTTNKRRISVDPPCGVLDVNEEQMLTIVCQPFDYESEDTNNDRVAFEWTNIPQEYTKQFRLKWLQDDGIVRRKNVPIEYNP